MTIRQSQAVGAWLCAVAMVVGCQDRAGEDPHAHEDEDEHGHEHEDGHEDGHGHGHGHDEGEEGESGELHVQAGMLRDLRITTRPAESRTAGDDVTVLGELTVNEEAYAEVGASIPARVSQVLVAAGDVVKAGQPLVELDSPELGRARASLASAGAELALAKQVAERRRGLAAEQLVAQRELQSAEAELAQATAQQQAAAQTLASVGGARGTGSRLVLSSPIAGTVIERNALRGRLVDAEHTLFVVGDLSRLWLVVHAFERDALRMRPGVVVRITFPALPGPPVEGTLTRVGSRVDPASRTVDVRIELDNPSGVLRPGMSATALVPVGDRSGNVITVPVEAVQRLPQGWCVFLPGKEPGHFQVRAIGRGRDLGAEVEVLSGLNAGEPVVVDGAFLLKAEADKARGGEEHHHH